MGVISQVPQDIAYLALGVPINLDVDNMVTIRRGREASPGSVSHWARQTWQAILSKSQSLQSGGGRRRRPVI